jgi:YD repeat-containing protein
MAICPPELIGANRPRRITGNRLLAVCGRQSRSLGHDAAGNVTTDTRIDGTQPAYGYDGVGRLATVTHNGLPEASYGYHAF